MINYHTELVNALKTILPTYYEMALTAQSEVPCISYMEINNYAVTDNQYNSFTVGYSRITYQVKVWANDIEMIQGYAIEIDKVLRPLGWKRISSGELYDNQSTMIQKILTYEALASETY